MSSLCKKHHLRGKISTHKKVQVYLSTILIVQRILMFLNRPTFSINHFGLILEFENNLTPTELIAFC